MNQGQYDQNKSSIKSLATRFNHSSAYELMAGDQSFGAFLEQEGFRAVPSPKQPFPGTDKYYRGGYITRTHGSLMSGRVDAIQVCYYYYLFFILNVPKANSQIIFFFKIECPSEVRYDGGEEMRKKFGTALAKVIDKFHNMYYEQDQNN